MSRSRRDEVVPDADVLRSLRAVAADAGVIETDASARLAALLLRIVRSQSPGRLDRSADIVRTEPDRAACSQID